MGNICAVSEKEFKDYLFSVVLLSTRFSQISDHLNPLEKTILTPRSFQDIIEIASFNEDEYRNKTRGLYLSMDPEINRKIEIKKLLRDYLYREILNSQENTIKFLNEIDQKLKISNILGLFN